MADGIEFSLTGVDELISTLNGVTYETKRKGGRAALRKAAQVVRDAARANAKRIDDPTTGESIAKNIVERWNGRHFRRTGDPAFRVGVLGGARQYANTKENVRKGRAGKTYATSGDKGNPGGDTWYWRHIEFGRGEVRPKKNGSGVLANQESGEFFGKHSAPTRAQPFMRSALAENIDKATDVFVAEYQKALDRAISRAAKKGTTA